jgi:hypothetical protein
MNRFVRAPIVSEFQSKSRSPRLWKMYYALTWGATLVGGVTMLCVDYPGNTRGDHVLKGAQDWARKTYENAILGENRHTNLGEGTRESAMSRPGGAKSTWP